MYDWGLFPGHEGLVGDDRRASACDVGENPEMRGETRPFWVMCGAILTKPIHRKIHRKPIMLTCTAHQVNET